MKEKYFILIIFSSRRKKYFSSNILPSNELNSIIIGSVLGDAGLYKSSSTSNTRLEMSFGQNSEKFAYYIGEIFESYMSNPVKSIRITGKDKVYNNYRLKTKTLPLFNYYFEMFYI